MIAKFLDGRLGDPDRLVPVIGAVLGFSETELAAVKTKRDGATPLDNAPPGSSGEKYFTNDILRT